MNRLTSWIRRNKVSRIAYVAVAVLGFVLIALDLLGLKPGAWIAEKVRPPQGVLGVWSVGYNFAPQAVTFQLGQQTGDALPPYSADGGSTNGSSSVCCYKPEHAGQPIEVRWRYYGGMYSETDRNVWHYKATLNPPFPKSENALVLTVRIYPGGRVAVRYTDKPEIGGSDNVSPELSGPGWVQAQGTPLPALLEKEQKARDSGHSAELETRPVPAIPTAAEAPAKTSDLTSPEHTA